MHDDRRKAYRFPVLQEQQTAALRVGDAEVIVRMMDQSATGFSVLAETHPGVFAGEMVWLKTETGWNSVRVVKVRHDEEGTRIGLERLGELPESPKRERSTNQVLGDGLKQAAPRSTASVFIGWSLAFVLVVGLLMWASTLKSVRFGSFVFMNSDEKAAEAQPAALAAVQNMAAQKQIKLQQAVQQFGATMMSLPAVMKQLQLSPEQELQLHSLLAATREGEDALRQKYRDSNSSSARNQLKTELAQRHEKASQKALQLLTPEQLVRWNEMVEAAMRAVNPK